MRKAYTCVCLAMILLPATASAGAVESLLQQYQRQGAGDFNPIRGKKLWEARHMQSKLGKPVSCASCHTTDLTRPGQHLRTGKHIEPMSPAVNPSRLMDAKKVEKWFRRNCRWTWGRVCTPQEKGDLLMFIRQSNPGGKKK